MQVTSFSVLQWIPDHPTVAKLVNEVLVDGGKFMFLVRLPILNISTSPFIKKPSFKSKMYMLYAFFLRFQVLDAFLGKRFSKK